MPTPIPCGKCGNLRSGPYTPDQCRFCWLAAHDPRYQKLWSVAPPRSMVSCRHLGAATGDTVDCPSCKGNVRVKLQGCAVHGRCTTHKPVYGTACCASCPDFAAPDPESPATRHLLYHVYPVSGNGTWQRNVEQLLRRIDQFNGRRVVAIATDRRTDPADAVKRTFQKEVHEFLVVPNDPGLREAQTLIPLLERVETKDPAHVVFYGHAKGVTRPVNEGVSVHPWTDIIYETLLDYPALVDEVLAKYPIAGTFKKVGPGFVNSRSAWHFSGSFFWARCKDLFARNWREVDDQWWGSESWTGLHYAPGEAGTIFHEGRVPSLNLYDMAYLRNVVLPELEAWRERYKDKRRATA